MQRNSTQSLVSISMAGFGLANAVRDLRLARRTGDRLALLDAVTTLASVLTGVAVAYRSLHRTTVRPALDTAGATTSTSDHGS